MTKLGEAKSVLLEAAHSKLPEDKAASCRASKSQIFLQKSQCNPMYTQIPLQRCALQPSPMPSSHACLHMWRRKFSKICQ